MELEEIRLISPVWKVKKKTTMKEEVTSKEKEAGGDKEVEVVGIRQMLMVNKVKVKTTVKDVAMRIIEHKQSQLQHRWGQ